MEHNGSGQDDEATRNKSPREKVNALTFLAWRREDWDAGGWEAGEVGLVVDPSALRNERGILLGVQSSKSGSRRGGHSKEGLGFVPGAIHHSSRKVGRSSLAGAVLTGAGSHPGKVTLKGILAVECWARSPLKAHSDGELYESLKAIFSTSLLFFPGEYIHVFSQAL